jgi:hypothetical protein
VSLALGSEIRRWGPVSALVLLVACRSPATGERPDAREPVASAAAPHSEIESVSCEGDSDCKLLHVLPEKANDLPGRHVSIVEHRCEGPRPRGPSGDRAYATWLLEGGPGAIRRAQLLSDRCLPHGKPTIEILGPDRIRQVQIDDTSDAGAPPASTISDFAVDPPRLLQETHVTPVEGTRVLEETWDFERSRGRDCVRRSPDVPCSTLGLAIPLLTVADPSFAEGSWKSVSLGDCGVTIDESTRDVFPSFEGGATTYPTVRALATDWDMYLEVSDDAFVVTGRVVDVLTVALSDGENAPDKGVAWSLFMDGRVKAGGGQVPRVEMVSVSPTLRRFRLSGNAIKWHRQLYVSYLDTADGVSVRRDVASGGFFLGELRRVLPDTAVCVSAGGSLRVRRTVPAPTPTEPLTH